MKNRILLVVVCLFGMPTFAGELEEIIVTAERRAESAQDVPVAISAYDEDTIEKNRIIDMGDLVAATPSFSYSPYSQVDPQLFIRGIGSSDDGAGGDPSVLVFQDDVVFARASGANNVMFDVQRIEVMRGPQGTLYGKNAAGGLVHIVTNDPTEDFGGSVSVTPVGEDGRLEGTAVLNTPINEMLQLRIAATAKQTDGYNRSLTSGDEVDDEDNISARVKLRYVPSDNFEGILALNFNQDNIHGSTRKPLPAGTFAQIGGADLSPDPRERQPTADDGYVDREIIGIAWNMDYELESGTLTSITAFRNVKLGYAQDLGGVPVPPFILRNVNIWREDTDQISQEFRYTFDAMNDRFHGLVGVFYLNEQVDREEEYDRTTRGIDSNVAFVQNNETNSVAVFGQATYDISDALSVTVGSRWSQDEKDIDLAAVDLSDGALPSILPTDELYAITTGKKWDKVTSSLSVDYAINQDILVYGRIAEGYKAGGFQTTPYTAAAAFQNFDPESSITYEIGVKADWWDKRIRTNLSVFQNDYEDLQVLQLTQTIPGDITSFILVTDNAADAEITGVELEVLAALTDGLVVGGTYSYLDTEFIDYITDSGDLSGNRMRRTPKDSYSIFGQYTLSLGTRGTVTVRADYQRKGTQFFENDNREVTFEPSYGLINASIRWLSQDERYQASLWGKNLDDELYRVNSISVADTGFTRIGPPRTWGLTLKYNFGAF